MPSGFDKWKNGDRIRRVSDGYDQAPIGYETTVYGILNGVTSNVWYKNNQMVWIGCVPDQWENLSLKERESLSPIGKTFILKNSVPGYRMERKCVGITPKNNLILETSEGKEFVGLTKVWVEVPPEPVVEYMYSSISYGYQLLTGEVFWGPKNRYEDNVKYTFTDGKLTGVELI